MSTPRVPITPMAFADVPRVRVGGLPLLVMSRVEGARLIVAEALGRRGRKVPPLFLTSANGNVVARAARDQQFRDLLEHADGIDADGQPLVVASRLMTTAPIPERSATTDTFHDVAKAGEAAGLRVYLLGGREDINLAAAETMQRQYPGLVLAGRRNGYFRTQDEADIARAIADAAPDVLWVGLGVPSEHAFVVRNRAHLAGVGVVKTCGGLFDFVAGKNSRAPQWMQDYALEWAYRLWLESRRSCCSPCGRAVSFNTTRLVSAHRVAQAADVSRLLRWGGAGAVTAIVQHRLRATVLRPARNVVADCNGAFLAERRGTNATAGDAVFGQEGADGFGTLLAETDIVFARTSFVCVAFKRDGVLAILIEPASLVGQRLLRLWCQVPRIGREVDDVADVGGEIAL
jgi:N-acetylglucosaminyldiphosphoundecaprenol N-acetyl-beta-D-mannosaminyltransferase